MYQPLPDVGVHVGGRLGFVRQDDSAGDFRDEQVLIDAFAGASGQVGFHG